MSDLFHPDAKTRINAKAKAAFSVQDYSGRPSIDGVQIVELKRFNDDGGRSQSSAASARACTRNCLGSSANR